MKIRISHLKEGLHEEIVEGPPEQFGLESSEELSEKIHVSMKIDRRNKDLFMRFNVNTSIKIECDRCLDKFDYKIDGQTATLFTSNKKLTGPEQDSVRLIDEHSAEIEIDEDVRDAVLLNLPIKAICKEDCKGICQCGQNLNYEKCTCTDERIDPRWEGLLKLRNNSSS